MWQPRAKSSPLESEPPSVILDQKTPESPGPGSFGQHSVCLELHADARPQEPEPLPLRDQVAAAEVDGKAQFAAGVHGV